MGFFDSINDTAQLTKNTFLVVGRNPEILKPTFAQIKIGLLFLFIVIVSTIAAILTEGTPQSIAIVLAILFILLSWPLFPFIRMYYKAAQAWIVYHTFTGKNISYKEGLKRASQNKRDIIVLAIFDIVMNILAARLKEGTGKGGWWVIVNILMWFVGRVIEEGWDLVAHFLLPAAIIKEKTVGEVLPEIKNIKHNVTGALAGVLGFDFVGDMVRGYLTLIMFLIAMLGIALGVYFNSWLLFVVIIILIIIFNMVAKVFIDMTKTIYFTLFYMSVEMPLQIKPGYREEVTHYLLYQSTETSKPQETEEQKISKLLPYIEQYRKQGYKDKEIIKFLVQNNWPEEVVKKALKRR